MELRGYIDVLRRRWWLILLGPLVAAVAAYALSKSLTPTYRATATVLVNLTQVPGVVQYNDVLTSERLTNTYAELVERRAVLSEVRTRLGLPLTDAELEERISVSTVRNTQLLRVSAEDHDPALAALLANTVAAVFIDDNANQLGRPGTVSITEEADVPMEPASPRVLTNTLLAAIVGLAAAGCLVLLQEYLDDTVKRAEDVEAIAAIPTLGVVGRFHGRTSGGSSSLEADSAESYRQLRTNIHFARLANDLKMILVTSSNPREGKSTTVANLATVLAQAGEKVIAIDTDLRRPSLHSLFQVPNSFGLTGLLLSGADNPERALLATGTKNLRILPSGPLPPNPSELLTSKQMTSLLTKLRGEADYVILDSPPLLAVTDASILAASVDGTILVLEMGKTRAESLRRSHEAIAPANTRILGAVINKAKSRRRGDYGYGYYRQSPGTQNDPPLETAAVEAVHFPTRHT